MKRAIQSISAEGVINILRESWLTSEAHVWLTEVNNSTGWRGGRQFADALACSVWPSRGIWLAGVEVKVARSDWRSELKRPAKSEEIQQYCRYWWVAAPEGVVKPEEVPDNWGYVLVRPELKRERHKIVKQAPKLDEKPVTLDFVASVLRNQAKAVEEARGRIRHEALEEVREKWDTVHDLEVRLHRAETSAQRTQKQLDDYQRAIGEFENSTGLSLKSWRKDESLRLVSAARALDDAQFDLKTLEMRAETLTSNIQALKAGLGGGE